MQIEDLYPIRTEDFPTAIETLTECFYGDPLYKALIPSDGQRLKILPDVFNCDVNELAQYCDLYAESEEVNGLIMLEDPSEHKGVRKFLAERYFAYFTEQLLAEDDETGAIAENFRRARDYLTDDWVKRVGENCIHIVYFAVRERFHGKGVAHKLITPVLKYADQNGVTVALETHNENNVALYRHYGFDVFDSFSKGFGLTEYCLVRRPVKEETSQTDSEKEKTAQ